MITKIVLTGGPCAGKSTALAKIKEHFTSLDYLVFTMPELATLFAESGVNLLEKNQAAFISIENQLIQTQLAIENAIHEIAISYNKPCIIIFDRGVMDIAAYLSEEQWSSIINMHNYSEVKLRDERYDMVIHLTTAANGAEKYYTNANNLHRSENIEQARFIDDKIIQAWTGHPHLRVITNSGDFALKMSQTIHEITSYLGIPEPIEVERKYKVQIIDNSFISKAKEITIFQTYLTTTDKSIEERVRKRGDGQQFIYFHTTKKTISETERIETEKIISPKEYLEYLERKDSSKKTIHKMRLTFVYEGQYFELDKYITPNLDFLILELEGKNAHNDINFPPFIEIIEDVTGNQFYSNYHLASIKN